MTRPVRGSVYFDVGSDVGGTFTDLWVRASDGGTRVVKSLTTADIVGGVISALQMAAEAYGLETDEFCRSIQRFGHGTTVGLNALLTGDTGRTAVITTDGFADTLEIGRMTRQFAHLSNSEVSDYLKRNVVPPMVPRRLVREVSERIDRTGAVLAPLDEADARSVVGSLAGDGVDAVAICTLWAPANPVHERRLSELVREETPSMSLSLSHEVSPVVGEYARMSTTALDATLKPVMSRYTRRLRRALDDSGLQVPVLMMTGTGGVVPDDYLLERPVAALLSGPAAGVVACQRLGRQMGRDQILTTDIGGTSFDVGLVVDGEPLMASEFSFGGVEINVPCIDVRSIGAGGGSIASVAFGELTVGPRSAGAAPGPACYNRGGTLPTATDADLILGVLAPEDFTGKGISLDRGAAARAIAEHVALPLGIGLEEAAWGIRQVLDNRMADLLRQVTIERGHDPREFTMFVNGGSGPSHGWVLARELGLREFVIPATATVQSALGTGTSDIKLTRERPLYIRIGAGDLGSAGEIEELRSAVAETVKEALEVPLRETVAGAAGVSVTVAIRYLGQSHHLDVPIAAEAIAALTLNVCIERFEAQYERLFGRGAGFRRAGFEFLAVRAVVTRALAQDMSAPPGGPIRWVGKRPVRFDDPADAAEVDVYAVELPVPGQRVNGPCIIAFPGQSAVVPPGSTAVSDEYGNLIVTCCE